MWCATSQIELDFGSYLARATLGTTAMFRDSATAALNAFVKCGLTCVVSLHCALASYSAVYCNRSCLRVCVCVCVFVCVFVGMLPR